MEKQKQAGADNLGVMFHLYHIIWIIALVAIFAFLDLWIALLIVSLLGGYFIWKY
jgi:hypothetical protein